jgi:glycosyltransferase involved in cell wall biosynthesis
MHVCFLCNEYPPGKHGGIGSFTQTLARSLAARGHEVTVAGVYAPDQAGVSRDAGVKVVRLPHTQVRGAGFVANGARLRRALNELHRTSPIDVLEGPEASLSMVEKDFPAAKVIRMHGGHRFFAVTLGKQPRPWRSWLEARSFARADHLCAVSNFVGEKTRELLGFGERHVEVLPNPVDVELFKPAPDHAEQRGLIVFVGTVCEKKGVRQLVAAMPQVVARVPEAKLWVVGRDGRDDATGESYTEMLRRTMPEGLRERVHFMGAVERAELPALLARASVCVYPSHMEALPVAWLEGMAMGKAVAASRIGPGAEVIADGESGLLCDPHDSSSIARLLVRLLEDEGLRRRLGRAARRRAEEVFSLDVLVKRNEDYYERCVSQRQRFLYVA